MLIASLAIFGEVLEKVFYFIAIMAFVKYLKKP